MMQLRRQEEEQQAMMQSRMSEADQVRSKSPYKKVPMKTYKVSKPTPRGQTAAAKNINLTIVTEEEGKKQAN